MGSAATPPYRHTRVALLRSAVHALTEAPHWWPDPDDPQSCRSWLEQAWSRPTVAEAIRQASPTLARRIDGISAGQPAEPKQIRRATVATAGYVLRALGRPTPFGLFAGVAPVIVGRTVNVRRGAAHRPVVRVDTQWLADVIDHLALAYDRRCGNGGSRHFTRAPRTARSPASVRVRSVRPFGPG